MKRDNKDNRGSSTFSGMSFFICTSSWRVTEVFLVMLTELEEPRGTFISTYGALQSENPLPVHLLP